MASMKMKYFKKNNVWNICDQICLLLILLGEILHITNQVRGDLDGYACDTLYLMENTYVQNAI